MKNKMKTREIKEELNKEIDQALPEADLKPFKQEKITVADDSTLLAQKKLDKFRYLTAVVILAVVILALALILPPIIYRPNQSGNNSNSTSSGSIVESNQSAVTCYIFDCWGQVHIITENGVILAIEGINVSGKIIVSDLVDQEYDYSKVSIEEFMFKLIEQSIALDEIDEYSNHEIRLFAINNDAEYTEQKLSSVSRELKQKSNEKGYKFIIYDYYMDFEEYNLRIDPVEEITDLDAQKSVILSMQKSVDDGANNG